MPPHAIILRTEGWLYEYHKWHKTQNRKSVREVQKWRKPGVRWLKCNFYGAWSKTESRGGGYGVVIRDHTGSCLGAVAGPVAGAASALYTELFAAHQVLGLLKSRYLPDMKINLEGDSSLALAAMAGLEEDVSVWGPVINDLRSLLMELPFVECGHVQREANSVAHRLARMGLNCLQEVLWFEVPSDLIQYLLFEEGM
ncbi:hypothetical protein ACFX14_012317 [Malus domestica]